MGLLVMEKLIANSGVKVRAYHTEYRVRIVALRYWLCLYDVRARTRSLSTVAFSNGSSTVLLCN